LGGGGFITNSKNRRRENSPHGRKGGCCKGRTVEGGKMGEKGCPGLGVSIVGEKNILEPGGNRVDATILRPPSPKPHTKKWTFPRNTWCGRGKKPRHFTHWHLSVGAPGKLKTGPEIGTCMRKPGNGSGPQTHAQRGDGDQSGSGAEETGRAK